MEDGTRGTAALEEQCQGEPRGKAGVEGKKAARLNHSGLHRSRLGTPHRRGILGRSHPAQYVEQWIGSVCDKCRLFHGDCSGD